MRFLRPLPITSPMLVSSTIPETDHPAWAAGTTYAAGARVISTTTHRIYESAIAGNVGQNPALGSAAWIDVGPTNRWAMFDQAPATRSTRTGAAINIRIDPGQPIDAVAVLEPIASTVVVMVMQGGTTLHTRTVDVGADGSLASAVTILDLPWISGATVVIRINPLDGAASAGTVLIGTTTDLGTTESGPTLALTDYSRRDTDAFGVTTVVERGWAKRLTARALVDSAAVDGVQRQLAAIRAVPVLWIGEEQFAGLTLYGFYKDFSVDLQLGAASYCSLTIEGLPTGDLPLPVTDPAVEGSSDLRVVRPLDVTDAVLTSSSVPETDYAEWSAATVYALGARVIRAATHRVYESLIAANIDNVPGAGTEWLDVGPTNRWAAFDQALGSVTTATGQLVVSLTPGSPVAALAALDVVAASVRVQAPGYDRTEAVTGGPLTFLDLAVAAGAAITVTIAGAAGTDAVGVGTLLIGALEPLGVIETSPTVSITDFSRKEADAFGAVMPVERAWAKRLAARSLVRSDAADAVFRRLASLRARPALWLGQEGFESLTLYGFFRDASIELGERTSFLALTIEGLSTAAPPAPALIDWGDIGDPDGTKPDDNADVTGDNTSKDTAAVAGRTAFQVLQTLDINVEGILSESLRQDDLVQVMDARTLVEGQPVSVQFLNFRDAQVTANAAMATSLTLLGAKNADGTAWVLDLQNVRVGPVSLAARFGAYDTSLSNLGLDLGDLNTQVGALATDLSELGVEYGDTKSVVTSLQEAFATDGGGYARFSLMGQVDSGTGAVQVVGISGIATSVTSELNFVAERFNFVSTNGGNPVKPFSIVGNAIYATNLIVDSITYGALVARFTDVGQQLLDPNGWYQVLPGGLIMQGGRYRDSISKDTAIPITFPRPFMTQVLAVGANGFLQQANPLADLIMQNLGEPTLTGAQFQAQATQGNAEPLDGFDWWAWGR